MAPNVKEETYSLDMPESSLPIETLERPGFDKDSFVPINSSDMDRQIDTHTHLYIESRPLHS